MEPINPVILYLAVCLWIKYGAMIPCFAPPQNYHAFQSIIEIIFREKDDFY